MNTKSLLSWRVVFTMILLALFGNLSAYTVIIDPGHGGNDPGAVRPGAFEKSLTLSTSLFLARELQRLGIPVVMTRTGDETVSLTSRRDLSARYPNSVFVSIHYNAAVNASAHGVETFYDGASSLRLANQVQQAVLHMTGGANRGVKRRGFKVLANNRAQAAILVEGGFLSHAAERRRCLDPRYQVAVAQGIVVGLINTMGAPRPATAPQPQWAARSGAPAWPTRPQWGHAQPVPAVMATFRAQQSGFYRRW